MKTTKCPQCSIQQQVPSHYLGHEVKCVSCGFSFMATKLVVPPPIKKRGDKWYHGLNWSLIVCVTLGFIFAIRIFVFPNDSDGRSGRSEGSTIDGSSSGTSGSSGATYSKQIRDWDDYDSATDKEREDYYHRAAERANRFGGKHKVTAEDIRGGIEAFRSE